jgi:CheY-like chemotaxis protein
MDFVVIRTDRRPLALLVEDERVIADDMSHLLEGLGLQTRICPTGEDALTWIAENRPPDVVILDTALPSLSGQEILSKLRRDPATREVPVVALPTHPHDGDALRWLEAREYAVKALPPEDSRRLIQAILQKLASQPQRRLVARAIRETLGGLLSKRRAEARLEGVVDRTVALSVSLVDLLRLVKARLDGLHGEDATDEGSESPFASDDETNDDASDEDEVVDAFEVEAPSLADLRNLWLPALGVRVKGDHLELDVQVPAPRRAHAR